MTTLIEKKITDSDFWDYDHLKYVEGKWYLEVTA